MLFCYELLVLFDDIALDIDANHLFILFKLMKFFNVIIKMIIHNRMAINWFSMISRNYYALQHHNMISILLEIDKNEMI